MVIIKRNFAPFGSSINRFDILTGHPNLDRQGLYTKRPKGCDPCLYSPQSLQKIFEVNRYRKVDKDPWRYKSELEAWAKNLGYRNQKILKQRKWQDGLLGPAWTSVPDPVQYEPACKNLNFGRTARFKSRVNNVPGPGTYYREVPFKGPYGPHSQRPSFEREEPCRFKDMCPRWSLAPDRYTIIDKDSIDQKSNRIVSLKGPYELFTGNRDGSTIKNHFNQSLRCSAATWPINLPGSFERLKGNNYGKMNKTNRDLPHRGRDILTDLAMCVRKPEDPSPGSYNVTSTIIEFKQNRYGFNSSYDKPPGYKRVVVWPGVGRYRMRAVTCGIPGQGHRHVFLSKLGRTIGAVIPEPMNSF